MEVVVPIIIWLLLCALVEKYASSKGRSGFFVVSFLLSPLIGFLIALLMSPNEKALKGAAMKGQKICPYCAERIQSAATVCKHCGRDLVSKLPERRSAAPIWYYNSGETKEGPFTADDIKLFIETGVITEETPVMKHGASAWNPLRTYREFAEA